MIDQLGSLQIAALLSVDERGFGATEAAALDISGIEGDIHLVLDAEAGQGTNPTLDLVVQHRVDSTDTWGAVPAASLYDPTTGETATFAQVTTTASFQRRALHRERLKAQIRVVATIGGTNTPQFVCAVYAAGPRKYSMGWDS